MDPILRNFMIELWWNSAGAVTLGNESSQPRNAKIKLDPRLINQQPIGNRVRKIWQDPEIDRKAEGGQLLPTMDYKLFANGDTRWWNVNFRIKKIHKLLKKKRYGRKTSGDVILTFCEYADHHSAEKKGRIWRGQPDNWGCEASKSKNSVIERMYIKLLRESSIWYWISTEPSKNVQMPSKPLQTWFYQILYEKALI
jgi:hypothetical protein